MTSFILGCPFRAITEKIIRFPLSFSSSLLSFSVSEGIISDPICYSRTSRGRRHRAWAGNQRLKGAELRLVSCFVTEIFYRRETHSWSGYMYWTCMPFDWRLDVIQSVSTTISYTFSINWTPTPSVLMLRCVASTLRYRVTISPKKKEEVMHAIACVWPREGVI